LNAAVNHLGPTAGGTDVAIGDSLIGVNGQTYTTRSTAVGTAPVYTKTILALETVASVATPAAATIAGLVKCFS